MTEQQQESPLDGDGSSLLVFRADGVPVASPLFQAGGGGSIPTSALHLKVQPIDLITAGELNRVWHSRLPRWTPFPDTRMRAWAACDEDEGIHAVAIWSRPIAANRFKNGHLLYELRRMACGPTAPKNTPSRFLAVMTRLIRKEYPDIEKLISYQDTAVHEGTIYKASGWTVVDVSEGCSDWRVHTKTPTRLEPQAPTPKMRWELQLREPSEIVELSDSDTPPPYSSRLVDVAEGQTLSLF